ncbi:MAG: hypothetical protein ABJB61_02220 [bacterium]
MEKEYLSWAAAITLVLLCGFWRPALRVVCVDKFYSSRDDAGEREIYAALRDRLSFDDKQRFDEATDLADGIKFNASKLSCVNGLDLEMAAETLTEQEHLFDIIISSSRD